MKKALLLVTSITICAVALAQRPYVHASHQDGEVIRCASDEKYKEALQNDPSYAQRVQAMEAKIAKYVAKHGHERSTGGILTIPVVVHVVYNTAGQNISDNQVISQINRLNKDYRMTNTDVSQTPAAFQGFTADSEIEFCLATVDPLGGATNGIVRVQTSTTQFSTNDNIKFTASGGSDAWDRDNYLNMWVGNLGGGLLGYAQFPGQGASTDGVVMGYNYFGDIAENDGSFVLSAPFNEGRTATHEVGHWLNLFHIWGSSGCAGSDQVADTPNQSSSYFGCPNHPQNSCTSDDMFMNYMDYVDDGCMVMFTQGQRTRMRACLNGIRSSLQASNGCAGASGVNAAFTASVTTVTAGGTVDFTDQSFGTITSWSWTFNGGTPSTSTAQNPMGIQYNTPGTYQVELTVSDGTNNDTETKVSYIEVVSSTACGNLNDPTAGTLTLYTSQGGAWVSGNNEYDDIAKADFFDNHSPFQYITGAIIGFGAANDGTGGATGQVSIWDDSGAGNYPGSIMATESINISDVDADIAAAQQTTITFATPWQITSDFYLGVQLPLNQAGGDTLAILTNTDGDQNPNIAWEEWGPSQGGGWYPYDSTLSWGLSVAHDIHPILCMTPSAVERLANVEFVSVYPNPTSGVITAHIGLVDANAVTVSIYNMLGEPVKVFNKSDVTMGEFKIDMSDQTVGMYFIEFVSGADRYIQKVNVVR